MKTKYEIIHVKPGTDYQGVAKFNVKIRGIFVDEVLGLQTQKTYYFTSYKQFVVGEMQEIDIKDYDIREFEYDTKDAKVGILKLKALAPKGSQGE
jgi:hypothetical protein